MGRSASYHGESRHIIPSDQHTWSIAPQALCKLANYTGLPARVCLLRRASARTSISWVTCSQVPVLRPHMRVEYVCVHMNNKARCINWPCDLPCAHSC